MPTIDYTSSAGLFKHLGALIARVNSYQAVGLTTLPADLSLLLAAFGVTWLPEEGVASYYEGLRDSVTGWRTGLAGFCDSRLLDFETVLKPLRLPDGSGAADTLLALRQAMRDDAQTVRACLCGAGAPSYAASNRGDGRAWITATLDGFNAPTGDGLADWSYDGQASQMTVPSETMTLECVADSVMDGMPAGGEAWRWTGAPDHGPLDVRPEGSGEGPGLQTAVGGANILTNGSLDTWSVAPSGWSLTGSATRSTSVKAHGTAAALMAGPATLTQALRSGNLQGRRRYWLGFSARTDGAALAGGRLELRLQGTGFSPGESARLDGSTLSGSWSHAGGFVTLPSPVPSDLSCVLECVNPSGQNVYADALAVVPAVYHGGLGAAVQAGPTVWQRGDRITWSVSNDQAGKFQDFFRRWYRCQLPCVASAASQGTLLTLLLLLMPSTGAETIAESLVA